MATRQQPTVPQSTAAEVAVLGSCLIDPEAIYRVKPLLQPEHFYLAKNRFVYAAYCKLAEEGKPLDLIAVTETLNRANHLKAVGGAAYITGLIGQTPSAIQVETYAELVHDAYSRRELLNLASDLGRGAYNADTDVDMLITQTVQRMRDYGKGTDLVRISDVIGDVEEEFLRNCRSPLTPGEVRYLDTGWLNLNNALGGWQSGLYVILGIPHSGKTWFCLQAAANVARQGKRALVFSLEMTPKQLAQRAAMAPARITRREYDSGHVPEHKVTVFLEAVQQIRHWDLEISEVSHTAKIFATIHREMRSEHPPDLVVIDYLGLLSTESEEENKNWTLNALTRSLKVMSRDLRVPIIVPHQVSDKLVRNRADKRPQAGDSYGTSGPEQHSDAILAIYRPSNRGETPPLGMRRDLFDSMYSLYPLKDRLGGGTGSPIHLRFDKSGLLQDLSRDDVPPEFW